MKRRVLRTGIAAILLFAMFAMAMVPAEAYTYNRQATIDYVKTNYDSWVPGSWYYMTRGVDCTNFLSQALFMKGGWPQRASYPWTANYQWYFYGVSNDGHSKSWTLVKEFGTFIVASGRGIEISFARSDVWTRPTKFAAGDIMQADWTGDGIWDHSMMITKIDGSDVYITQHSDNLKDKRVSEIIQKYPNVKFRVFLLKNTFVY